MSNEIAIRHFGLLRVKIPIDGKIDKTKEIIHGEETQYHLSIWFISMQIYNKIRWENAK